MIICSVIATGVLGLSFLNPFFFFDDLIYYGIIAAIIIGMLACNDGSFRGIPGIAWSTRTCGGCGGVLPPRVRVGMPCPHCGVFLGGERKSFMGMRAGGCYDDDYPRPVVFKPRSRGRQSSYNPKEYRLLSSRKPKGSKIDEYERTYVGPTGYESTIFTAGDNVILPGDALVPETERKRAGRFDGNPELEAFNPPFDGLFKDQSAIKNLFSNFLNWAAIGASLRRWVKEVQDNPHLNAIKGDGATEKPGAIRSDAEIDAVAKLEAWKVFERGGFTEPLKLPELYKKLVKQQEDADKATLATGDSRSV
jgi:hypothetical protein